jgi:hypothetical protein
MNPQEQEVKPENLKEKRRFELDVNLFSLTEVTFSRGNEGWREVF